MTGQPTPDRPPTQQEIVAVIREGLRVGATWDVMLSRVSALLEGCAVIDGTPRRLEALTREGWKPEPGMDGGYTVVSSMTVNERPRNTEPLYRVPDAGGVGG